MRDTTKAGAFRAGGPVDNLLTWKKGKAGGSTGPTVGQMGHMKARLERIAAKTPEVMVKITGSAKGAKRTGAHLSYITREGALQATNERGEVIEGKDAVKDLTTEWLADRPAQAGSRRAPDTRNMVLSMPPGTDPDLVFRAVRTFADKEFGDNHQFVAVLHTDEKHPHVHLTVKTRGFDGKNLNPKKADLQRWREGFAKELRALDIPAEATPRQLRGVVKKPDRQPIRHMRKRGKLPRVDLERAQAAASKKQPHPAEVRALANAARIRAGWKTTADALRADQDPDARRLAGQVERFAAELPRPTTARQQLSEAMRSAERNRAENRGATKGTERG